MRWLLRLIQDAPPPGDRAGRLMMAAGHYGIVAATAWSAYAIGDDLAGNPRGPVDWGMNALFAAFIWCWYSDMRWHSARLCERCASSSPIDPQAQVRRWKQALGLLHRIRDRKPVLVGVLVVACGITFVPYGPWRQGAQIALIAFLDALWTATWKHNILQPWCPWCDWGKGGGKEVSPEVPDPALSK
jgi:hypothetical protein